LKLYNSNLAPNPRRVRIFLAKKGLSIPRVEVDLGKLEHKRREFAALNLFQTIPILELDDGTMIDESIAICRYIEELCPEPNLFGATALERAMVEMWQRRLEWRLFLPIAQAFRHAIRGWRKWRTRKSPTGGRPTGRRRCGRWRLSTRPVRPPFHRGRPLHSRRHHRLVALDFAKPARIAIPPELKNLNRGVRPLLLARAPRREAPA
jgi:glutathione S-transferase